MEKRTPIHKRVFLINKKFQIPYVGMAVVLGFGSTLLTSLLILYPLFYFNILKSQSFLPTPFLTAMVLASILNLIVITGIAVIITHRIAGPMYALSRHLNKIKASNQLGRQLKVRKSDEMQFVVEQINDLTMHLQTLAHEDLNRVSNIKDLINVGDIKNAMNLANDLQQTISQRLVSDSGQSE